MLFTPLILVDQYRAIVLDVDRGERTVAHEFKCFGRCRRIAVLVDDCCGECDTEARADLRNQQRQRTIEIVEVAAVIDRQELVNDQLNVGRIVCVNQREAQNDEFVAGNRRIADNPRLDGRGIDLNQHDRALGRIETGEGGTGQRGRRQIGGYRRTIDATGQREAERLRGDLLTVGARAADDVEERRELIGLTFAGQIRLDLTERRRSGQVGSRPDVIDGSKNTGVVRVVANRFIERVEEELRRSTLALGDLNVDRRRVVVDRERQRADDEVAVAVGHLIVEREVLVVFITTRRMTDRIELGDRVVAGGSVVECDLQDVDDNAVLQLANGQNRAGRIQRIGESRRRAGAEQQHRTRTVLPEREAQRSGQRRRAVARRIKVGDAGEITTGQTVFVEQHRGIRRHGRHVIDEGLVEQVRDREARQLGRAEQIKRVGERQRVDADAREVRARRLRVAGAGAGRRQDRLIFGDGEQGSKFSTGQIATRRHFDRDVAERLAVRVEERFERQHRLVVEQDDQLLADVDERNLLVRDGGKIGFDRSVIAQRNGD